MYTISHKKFESLVAEAIKNIPPTYKSRLQNVAFIVEDDPSPEQRLRLNLSTGQSLFGLYEGTPLPNRGGMTKLLPDKITLFKNPLESVSTNLSELKRRIAETVWHEVAHYYGLDHKRIDELNNR